MSAEVKVNMVQLAAALKRMNVIAENEPYIKIGLIESTSSRSLGELSNPEIGLINEYGTSGTSVVGSDTGGDIPARPFLRTTMQMHRRKYEKMLARAVKNQLEKGTSLDADMGLIGQQAAADMKKVARSNMPPPNAEYTIKKKGSSKTLVDSGQMINAISYITGKGPSK